MAAIKRTDWVTCTGSSLVGMVQRMAKDGTWADVDWGTHSKRMNTAVLTPQSTIHRGEWEITDVTRQRELEQEKE